MNLLPEVRDCVDDSHNFWCVVFAVRYPLPEIRDEVPEKFSKARIFDPPLFRLSRDRLLRCQKQLSCASRLLTAVAINRQIVHNPSELVRSAMQSATRCTAAVHTLL